MIGTVRATRLLNRTTGVMRSQAVDSISGLAAGFCQ